MPSKCLVSHWADGRTSHLCNVSVDNNLPSQSKNYRLLNGKSGLIKGLVAGATLRVNFCADAAATPSRWPQPETPKTGQNGCASDFSELPPWRRKDEATVLVFYSGNPFGQVDRDGLNLLFAGRQCDQLTLF